MSSDKIFGKYSLGYITGCALFILLILFIFPGCTCDKIIVKLFPARSNYLAHNEPTWDKKYFPNKPTKKPTNEDKMQNNLQRTFGLWYTPKINNQNDVSWLISGRNFCDQRSLQEFIFAMVGKFCEIFFRS